MSQRRNADSVRWMWRALLGISLTLLVLSALALVFARWLSAPIRRFADAAHRLGVDQAAAPVPETGPRELRTAARALNAMQARLSSLVARRTEMLATVAHDMRTPLMRMRLALEGAEPAVQERVLREAAKIEELVSAFIAFARDDPAREERVRLDLSALLQSAAADRAEAGQSVEFSGVERLVLTGQPLGLRRLFDNIMDNAVKYGGAARVSLRVEDGQAVVDVADDGPGVPVAEREAVFRPFVRGAGAVGSGAGLGLASARELARGHGGEIEIIDSSPGGLFRVRLPL